MQFKSHRLGWEESGGIPRPRRCLRRRAPPAWIHIARGRTLLERVDGRNTLGRCSPAQLEVPHFCDYSPSRFGRRTCCYRDLSVRGRDVCCRGRFFKGALLARGTWFWCQSARPSTESRGGGKSSISYSRGLDQSDCHSHRWSRVAQLQLGATANRLFGPKPVRLELHTE